jgi:hypothetical protein
MVDFVWAPIRSLIVQPFLPTVPEYSKDLPMLVRLFQITLYMHDNHTLPFLCTFVIVDRVAAFDDEEKRCFIVSWAQSIVNARWSKLWSDDRNTPQPPTDAAVTTSTEEANAAISMADDVEP